MVSSSFLVAAFRRALAVEPPVHPNPGMSALPTIPTTAPIKGNATILWRLEKPV
jgi:hypothetical protein